MEIHISWALRMCICHTVLYLISLIKSLQGFLVIITIRTFQGFRKVRKATKPG